MSGEAERPWKPGDTTAARGGPRPLAGTPPARGGHRPRAWTRPARLRRRRTLVTSATAIAVAVATAASTTGAPAATAATARASSALASPPSPCPSPARVKPTVVLVHGAWAGTSSWDGEVASLRRAGYVARAIANPLRGLTADAASVAAFLKTVPGPIVLAGHSYGGSVITNAAAGVPNVKALVYVDAAAPDVGETTGGLSGPGSALGGDPGSLYDTVPSPGAPAGADDLYLKQEVFVRSFASDLPRETAVRLWATQRAASAAAFTTPSRAAAWKTIPSWYFVSTGDRIITRAAELSMARRARSTVTEFPGGSHLTLISHPDAVTTVIGSAICSVR
ncbi:alpha/beta hydrolase [Sphaerisporangium sp. TRM90804]|uniref:alpha/beta hydrolase n=1 Tax=Sphaerisporangium sp. TRM90804 TaxID=3031113 RepID=UPI00244B873A|nr:alpha/beta hydrolase [Sphaerisporangium sp. TRM90804]MDH2426107.1 alpha/beta hydrolase [Sphaerisporangium sp. TRM90804]